MGTTKSNVKIIAQAELEDNTTIGQTAFNIIVLQRSDQATRFSGTVMDHSGIPIQGIQFSIARTNLTALSDENGRFRFPNNVPTGKIDLFVDGRNVQVIQNGETIEYPALHFETAIIQGQNNQLPHPVYLPPVHIENTKTVGGNQDVTLTIPGFQGFKMIVKANSVTFPDGSNEGELVVNPVHNDRLPMVTPGTGGRFMATGWTLQPTGTRFDPPIEVHIPNTDGLKPGTTVPIVQWDHDMAYFVPMGQGTISEDGSVLVTNPGSGITKAGWGGGPPPPPTIDEGNDDENECTDSKNQKATSLTISANGVTGELITDHIKDGTDVKFTAVIGGSCEAPSYQWTFGDNSGPSQEESPTHKYTVSGEHNVKLDVSCKSCDPISATYRVGLKCNVEEIVGECIVKYDESIELNTDSNDPDRTEWEVEKGGTPQFSNGEPFDLIFNRSPNSISSKSEVEAVCNATFAEENDITVTTTIGIAKACSEYEPTTYIDKIELDENILQGAGTNFGLYRSTINPNIAVRSCVNDNSWNFRIVRELPTWDIETDYHGRTLLTSPESNEITNDNCVLVIEDLTPIDRGSGYLEAKFSTYIVPYILESHEIEHLKDSKDIIYTPLYNQFKTKVDDLESRITECSVENPYEELFQPYVDKITELNALYEVDREKRVYDNYENPALYNFINLLKQRATREKWSNTLCRF